MFILVCFIFFFSLFILFLQVFFLLPFFFFSFLSPLLLCHTYLIMFCHFVLLLLVPSFTLHPGTPCSFPFFTLPCYYLLVPCVSPCYLPGPTFAFVLLLRIPSFALRLIAFLFFHTSSCCFNFFLMYYYCSFPPCCFATYYFVFQIAACLVLVHTSPPLSLLQVNEFGTGLEH